MWLFTIRVYIVYGIYYVYGISLFSYLSFSLKFSLKQKSFFFFIYHFWTSYATMRSFVVFMQIVGPKNTFALFTRHGLVGTWVSFYNVRFAFVAEFVEVSACRHCMQCTVFDRAWILKNYITTYNTTEATSMGISLQITFDLVGSNMIPHSYSIHFLRTVKTCNLFWITNKVLGIIFH